MSILRDILERALTAETITSLSFKLQQEGFRGVDVNDLKNKIMYIEQLFLRKQFKQGKQQLVLLRKTFADYKARHKEEQALKDLCWKAAAIIDNIIKILETEEIDINYLIKQINRLWYVVGK